MEHIKKLRKGFFSRKRDVTEGNGASSELDDDTESFVEVNVLRTDINELRGFSSNEIRTSKYTPFSALPFGLLTQFYKVSNVYFLLVVAISLIPSASPISPLTAVIPFSAVLGVGILKDIWVDVKLQRADKKANMTEVFILRNGEFVSIPSREVYPGDVVLCRVGEEVRVDCVVLSTSLPEGVLYIETTNLDGESNAKIRRAKPETVDKLDTVEAIEELALLNDAIFLKHEGKSYSFSALPRPNSSRNVFANSRGNSSSDERDESHSFSGASNSGSGILITGSAPNPDLSNWMGKLRFPSGDVVALDINQFLPSGCVIRNTEWVLAVAMYAGKDTKISHNYHARKRKVAMLSRKLNHLNIFIFIIFQCCVILLSGLGVLFRNNNLNVHRDKETYSAWYIKYDLERHGKALFFWRYLTNFVIFSYLIPVSLYVTLEFNKGVQLAMMAADFRMSSNDKVSGKRRFTKPKTSDCTAELAHVRYIFTDKTGTLTENLMTYVGGFLMGNEHDEMAAPGGVGKQLYQEIVSRYQALREAKMNLPRQDMLEIMKKEIFTSKRRRKHGGVNPDTVGRKKEEEVEDEGTREINNEDPSLSNPLPSPTPLIVERLVEPSSAGISSERFGQSPLIRNAVRPLTSGASRCLPSPDASDKHFNDARQSNFSFCPVSQTLMESIPEKDLESHPAFRYLRCLSLCHSILCFEIKEDEDNENVEDIKIERDGEIKGGENVREMEGMNPRKDLENVRKAVDLQTSGGLSSRVGAVANTTPRMGLLSPKSSVSGWHGHLSDAIDNRSIEQCTTPKTRRSWVRGGARSLSWTDNISIAFNPIKSPGYRDGERSAVVHENSRSHLRMTSVLDFANVEEGAGLGLGTRSCTTIGKTIMHDSHNSLGLHQHGVHSRRETLTSMHGRQAVLDNSLLSSFIDRTKIYEGQSLDEVALVNAARENGFSLLSRSNRFIIVKMLDANYCYQIIAENAFTPERKLMSILLKRCPLKEAMALENKNVLRDYHRSSKRRSSARTRVISVNESSHPKNSFLSFFSTRGRKRNFGSFDKRGPMRSSFVSVGDSRDDMCPIDGYASNIECRNSKNYFGSNILNYSVSSDNVQGNPSGDVRTTQGLPSRFCSILSGASPRATNESIVGRTQDISHEDNLTVANSRQISPFGSITLPPKQDELKEGKRERRELVSPFPNASNKNDSDVIRKKTCNVADGAVSSKETDQDIEDDDDGHEEKIEHPPYLLLVKGADSSVFKILNENSAENQKLRKPLARSLDSAARGGLRTLVLGQRYVTQKEVDEWVPLWENAASSMNDRHQKLSEVYKLIEKDIELVGTTCVEDKLQDNVPETLQFFRDASIVVWMLTGDKRETAVRIAITSGLTVNDGEDFVVHLDANDDTIPMHSTQGAKLTAYSRESSGTIRLENLASAEQLTCHDYSPLSGTPLPDDSADETLRMKEESNLLSRPGHFRTNSSPTRITGPHAVRDVRCIPMIIPDWFSCLLEKGNAQEIRVGRQLIEARRVISHKALTFDNPVVLLVVDGATLDILFSNEELKKAFLDISTQCGSAVCCRMTPAHKARIVQMFKSSSPHVLLAIGDGANDVSMIQESHVGIGVMGLEGSQAEMCSDYAIPKFRFLKRLLVVHGRLSFYRDAHCVLFCLYKSILLVSGLGLFSIFNGYSGEILVNSWLLAFFNLFFTSLQPFLVGIFDKDIDDELAEALPQLYPAISHEKMFFSIPYIGKWIIDGLVEGVFVFLTTVLCVGRSSSLLPYYSAGLVEYGVTIYTIIIILANIRIYIFLGNYNILSTATSIGLLALLILVEVVFCSFHYFLGPNEVVYVATEIFGSPVFYLLLLAGIGVSFLWTFTSGMYIQRFAPWLNAPFAVEAARKSPYTADFAENLRIYKTEFRCRVAYKEEYEALRSDRLLSI